MVERPSAGLRNSQSERDRVFMTRALKVARKARFNTSPNPGVGCVLVRDEQILAEGWTQQPGHAHAEVMALSHCDNPLGSTAYVTLEPCAHTGRTGPCVQALIESGVGRVVAALEDPFEHVRGSGFAQLQEAGVEVTKGVMAEEARELHAGFLSRLERGRPWVTLKIAASLDGATALSNGVSQWITNEQAREDVHWMRAASDVVLTGAGTVVADNPRLTSRIETDQPITQPRAVVVDSGFRSPPESLVLQRHSLVYTAPATQVPSDRLFEHAILPTHSSGDGLDLHKLMTDLAAREVNTVMVEAGAVLSGALVRAQLVDRLVVYQAPKLMGTGTRGMLELGNLTRMDQVINLELIRAHRIGDCSKMEFALGSPS